MSQTIVQTAPTGGPPQSGLTPAGGAPGLRTLGHRLASASATVRHYLAGSPGRLRVVAALAVLAAVLVALGGGAALRERSGALDEAKSSAAHLVLVQSVQINLVQADADVTNAFLRFGLEPVKQQLDFISRIETASNDLALAANASPEDAKALGEVNADLTRYMEFIGRARANNRFGKPVGANYLSTASDLLRTDIRNDSDVITKKSIVTLLSERAAADVKKIDSAYSRATRASWWLALVAILGIGVLVWAQVYLAQHSRRILNIPLASATVGVLAALIVAAGAMFLAQTRANDVQNGPLAETRALSQSRVSAFDAKSWESLTLISRGSGTTNEPRWKASFDKAKALPADSGPAAAALAAYEKQHQAIRKADDGGEWKAAVALAISESKTSGNVQFEAYAAATEKTLKSQAAATASGLEAAGNALLPAGILVLLAGLLAAVGAWIGISLRLDEYR